MSLLRRVKKSDVQVANKPVQLPISAGLEYCLECWVGFMHKDDRDLSAALMKICSMADDRLEDWYESDPYGEQRAADVRIGEATGAMIDSLSAVHRWTIYRRCGMTTQWNFKSVDYLSMINKAEEALEGKLRKNIATAIRF